MYVTQNGDSLNQDSWWLSVLAHDPEESLAACRSPSLCQAGGREKMSLQNRTNGITTRSAASLLSLAEGYGKLSLSSEAARVTGEAGGQRVTPVERTSGWPTLKHSITVTLTVS